MLKLDELVLATEGARNRVVLTEHLTDQEMELVRKAIEVRAKGGNGGS